MISFMKNSAFLHFLTLLLFKEKSKHIGAVLISVVIIFLLSSVLFVSSSLQESLAVSLKGEPDFVVSRIQAGRAVNTPMAWYDKIVEIEGIAQIAPRIHGRYYFAPKEKSFLVIGIDFFDEQSSKALGRILKGVDLKEFFSEESMLVGSAVQKFMADHFYKKYFSFKTPSGTFKKVRIYASFPKESNLFSNDVVLMPIELAREIFGMAEDEVTDITFNVPNDAEWDNIMTKLYLLFYDLRAIDRKEIGKAYATLYNYKGGLFLILYLITIVTFMLILYQRYSMVYSAEKKEIGILRAIGWSIKDILRLKFYETLIIVVTAFVIGVCLAYFYVFVFHAPVLKEIFLGDENLANHVTFVPTLKFGILGSIFLFYAVPFFAAVLVPVWKIAITPPKEAML